jgi:hypothetical protein
VCALAGACAGGGEVQADATPRLRYSAFDEPERLEAGSDLAERLLGLWRAARNSGDRDAGSGRRRYRFQSAAAGRLVIRWSTTVTRLKVFVTVALTSPQQPAITAARTISLSR